MYNTETSVKFVIPNISNLVEVKSPKYVIQGIPWQLLIRKETSGDKHALALYLFCTLPVKRSHAARTVIKIFRSDDSKNSFKCCIDPYVFNNNDDEGLPAFGNTFIPWEDLFNSSNRFVKDDKITMKVRIIAEDKNDPNRSELDFNSIGKSCDEGCISTFLLKISNVTNLMAVRSPVFRLGNSPFDLTVYKHLSHVGIRLKYNGKETFPHEVVMTATLLSIKQNKTISKTGRINTMLHMQEKLTMWDDLINERNHFINDHSIVIEVEVKKAGFKVASCSSAGTVMKCPICFDVLQQQEISATKCGHIFCSACITSVVRAEKRCPMCNAAVNMKDFFRIYLPL